MNLVKFLKKKPFLIFFLLVTILTSAALSFIQSEYFANIVKSFLFEHLPKNSGLVADFSEVQINIFPPGISVEQPKISIERKNQFDVPVDATISSERIDFKFYPLQVLSGSIRLNEVVIYNGTVDVKYYAQNSQKTDNEDESSTPGFSWDELLRIKVEAIALEKVNVQYSVEKPKLRGSLFAENLKFGQWIGRGGIGYEILLDVKNYSGEFPKEFEIPSELQKIDELQVDCKLNALGTDLRYFRIKKGGVELSLTGWVAPFISDPETIQFELRPNLVTDLQSLKEYVDLGVNGKGNFSISGLAKGDFKKIEETVSFDGEIKGANVELEGWSFENISLKAGWVASLEGERNVINFKGGELSSPVRGRSKGVPGWGGKITIQPLRVSLEDLDQIAVEMDIDNAHLHWLVAPGVEDIFALDLRATGRVGAVVSGLKSEWNIRSRIDLRIPTLTLDNQRLEEERDLSMIVSAKNIHLLGGVLVNPKKLTPEGLKLSFDGADFDVLGAVDFKNGLALKISGQADLSQVRRIAEVPITGKGTMTTLVEGPFDDVSVHFDCDMKRASYLDLNLGDLNGRISWLDKKNVLRFTNVKLHQGQTDYIGSGDITFAKEDTINLDLRYDNGRIQDFFTVFNSLTKDIWWFPKTLTGDMVGTAKVSGGLTLNTLKVETKFSGSNFDFIGEKFKEVSATGGYDGGKYYLKDVKVRKYRGGFSGAIAYLKSGNMEWSIQTHDFNVSDFDRLASLDVPLRGKVRFDSTGQGKWPEFRSNVNLSVEEVVVRGVNVPNSYLAFEADKSFLRVQGRAQGTRGNFDIRYGLKPGSPSHIRAQFNQLDFSPVLLLLNPELMKSPNLKGTVSGKFNIEYKSGQIEKAVGSAELTDYILEKSGAQFELSKPVFVKIDQGSFNVRDFSMEGKQGKINIDLKSQSGRLFGKIAGDLNMSLLEFVTPNIVSASGSARLDYVITGSLSKPKVEGSAYFKNAEIKTSALNSPFEAIEGNVILEDGVFRFKNVRASLSGGRVNGRGTIEVFTRLYPTVDLFLFLNDNKMEVGPFQYVTVSGNLNVTGTEFPYHIKGDLEIADGMLKESVLEGGGQVGSKTLKYLPPSQISEFGGRTQFDLDINVKGSRNLKIKSNLFDMAFKTDLVLKNTLESPIPVGTVEVLSGKLNFKDREFNVQSARADFDSPTVLNPRFDFIATSQVNDVAVRLYAYGRMNDQKLEITSDPPMSESEIFSLLALGLTREEVQKIRAEDRENLQRGEAASLLLHSFDFNRDVQDRTGFQIGLDEAVDKQVGNSLLRSQAQGDASATPKIVVRRKIGKKVDISVGKTLEVGNINQREVSANIKLNQNFSFSIVAESLESQSKVSTQTSGQSTRESFGADIKFQKRFRIK